MIAKSLFQLLWKVFFYLGVYLIIGNQLNLFGMALCFSYAGAVLLLPVSINPVRVLFFAFVVGFIMDIFHSSPGIHAASCLMLAFFRANFLHWMVPAGGYEDSMTITPGSMGLRWYFTFASGLLLIHSLMYFFLDYAGFSQFGMLLLRSLLSSMFTLAGILLLQYAIEPPRRSD